MEMVRFIYIIFCQSLSDSFKERFLLIEGQGRGTSIKLFQKVIRNR